MTKDEYGDFVLRYKGCGACFPMYHTLSRFEKMWFTAIQKDVANLEKENAELKNNFRICEKNADTYYDNLTKATEIIEGLMRFCRCFAQHHTEDIRYKEAEQFLKESE